AHGLPEIVVEIREQSRIGAHAGEVPEVQPLLCKIRYQRLGTWIRKHAVYLLFQHRAIAKPAANSEIQELIIGDATPQEERKPRCEFQIRNPIRRIPCNISGSALDPEKEFRTDENCLQRQFDTALEASFNPTVFIEAERTLNIRIRHRLPVRTFGKRRN